MSGSPRDQFQRSFQVCPIFLTGGVAASLGDGLMPIIQLTQPQDMPTRLDHYFAQFQVMAGSTLTDNAVGMYPFGNQAVAANALIAQPLKVSMEMIVPASARTTLADRLSVISNMQAVLQQHTAMGGLFIVATPSYVYNSCILTRLADISTGDTGQKQFRYQWDFVQPLVTLAQAQTAQNSLMSKISNGTQTDGSLSGPGTQTGNAAGNTQPYTGAQAGTGTQYNADDPGLG